MKIVRLTPGWLFLLFVCLSCGNSSSPEDVAEKYTKALMEYDFEVARTYATENFQASHNEVFSAFQQRDENKKKVIEMVRSVMVDAKFNILEKKIDGDVAVITLSVQQKGSSFLERQVVLQKEDGVWKVNQKAEIINYQMTFHPEHGVGLDETKSDL